MGKEEEIARIARRLDKMVTRKNAVRGAGRQDPGAPLRGHRLNETEPRQSRPLAQARPPPCRFAMDATLTESRPLFVARRWPRAFLAQPLSPLSAPTLQNQVSLINFSPAQSGLRQQQVGLGRQ